MSIEHTLQYLWQSGNNNVIRNVAVQGEAEVNIDVTINDGQTDIEIDFAVTMAALLALYIVSDQDLTIETNSSSAPDDTIALKAGVPLVWTADDPHGNPFTADVTKLFATNASGTNSPLTIRALKDATP